MVKKSIVRTSNPLPVQIAQRQHVMATSHFCSKLSVSWNYTPLWPQARLSLGCTTSTSCILLMLSKCRDEMHLTFQGSKWRLSPVHCPKQVKLSLGQVNNIATCPFKIQVKMHSNGLCRIICASYLQISAMWATTHAIHIIICESQDISWSDWNCKSNYRHIHKNTCLTYLSHGWVALSLIFLALRSTLSPS